MVKSYSSTLQVFPSVISLSCFTSIVTWFSTMLLAPYALPLATFFDMGEAPKVMWQNKNQYFCLFLT